MDAIILAAGLGTRLRPYTETVPKPLLLVRGRPILDWSLGALPPAVDRLLVVVNYLGEQIEAYLKQQRHVASALVVWQKQPRGTGDAVLSCRDQLRGGAFLVLNGDDLYGAADLAALARHEAGLLVAPVNEPEAFGIATVRPDGTLAKLVEKPKGLAAPQMANAGAYVFPGDVFRTKLIESPRGEYEITQYVSAEAERGRVHAVRCHFWLPIGDVPAWRAAEGVKLEGVMKGK